MTPEEYLAHLRSDGSALATAAAVDLRAPVPSCPEWLVGDLVWHTGQVYLHKAAVIEHGGTERPEVEIDQGPDGDEGLIEWYREGLSTLLDVLSAADPDAEAWTFFGDKKVAFWYRRMAQEAAIHRWDAEAATGSPHPIYPELAWDGVDEMLNVHVPADETHYEGKPGTVHLHRTDGEGEWLIDLARGEIPSSTPIHDKGDAALKGTASDLVLLLWRRRSPDDVESFGDGELIHDLWKYLAGPGT